MDANKYLRARIIGLRAEQLEDNCDTALTTEELGSMTDAVDIATREYDSGYIRIDHETKSVLITTMQTSW